MANIPPNAAGNTPAPGAGGAGNTPAPGAGVPMMAPHVMAMMGRPHPNPQQMYAPVGMAAVMRMQMMNGAQEKGGTTPEKK